MSSAAIAGNATCAATTVVSITAHAEKVLDRVAYGSRIGHLHWKNAGK
jgi:hypothetical protein